IWLFHIEIRGISTLGCWFWILSLPAVMSERSTSRMLMEHKDDQGQSVFTSRSWRRLFEVQGPVVFELIMEFFSKFRFNKVVVNIDVDDTVMSDSKDFMVTYTAVSSPFRGLSDIGSPGVDGPPAMPDDLYAYMVAALQALPSPDYVSGLEYPPSPDFVPELVYPEFMPLEDEEDLEEDDDEDPKEDPANYPVDRGDDGDDEDESSDDDKDDVDIEADEEEEGHLAPADSIVVALPAIDQAPFAEETKPFKTDESAATPPPHPAYREVARLLAIPTPPPSTLSPWSSPLPYITSLPLPLILSPLLILPRLLVSSPPSASPICLLGYRATMIRLRIEAPSTSHSLPLPLPIILSHTRSDAPSLGTPPLLPYRYLLRHHLYIYSLRTVEQTDPREIMRDLERDVSYRITDTWDEMLVDMPRAPATDDIEDRRAHARTARLMKAEA
ncbi:hypothetical protein Tco_0775704, partial [Tanacetum coccineum]